MVYAKFRGRNCTRAVHNNRRSKKKLHRVVWFLRLFPLTYGVVSSSVKSWMQTFREHLLVRIIFFAKPARFRINQQAFKDDLIKDMKNSLFILLKKPV
jgi:hypothetical protein